MKTSPEGLLHPEQVALDPLGRRGYGLGSEAGTRAGRRAINLGSTRDLLFAARLREFEPCVAASGYFDAAQALAGVTPASANIPSFRITVTHSDPDHWTGLVGALSKMEARSSSVAREEVVSLLSDKTKLPKNSVCFHETHQGTVSEILGDEVEVTYELPEGPLKQIYCRDQFLDGKVPSEGDTIKAEISLTLVPRAKKAKTGSELPDFSGRAESGTVHI